VISLVLRATALAVVALSSAACAVLEAEPPKQTAQIAEPAPSPQAPGYYRVKLGDFTVTALSDGTLPFESDEWLTGIEPAQIEKALTKAFLKSPIEMSFNAFLVDTGEKLVLIDTGSGAFLGPNGGKLLTNMQAAGYRPEQVDEVYITHLHVDHLGGLVTGETVAFSNAIVRADQHDVDYWLSEENANKAPEQMKLFFQAAQASLKPYREAGKFKSFDGDTNLVPGVKAVGARGHTPGHAIYIAESKGERMLFWGDLLHVAAVQLPNPSVTVIFDADSKAAALQRKKVLSELAKSGDLIGAAHISFPGIGHVRSAGKGFDWVSINYSSNVPLTPAPVQ
jgi:glyoxylase-like metal-dependent hydrolase (beta-lactamase superfamily II)